MAASKLATIGILSLGDMGTGIAKLLVAKGFSVATNAKGRSQDTLDRVKAAQVENITSDIDLVKKCDVLLSIVPPRDAAATAQRVIDALSGGVKREPPLYFADMNAVAPSTIKDIAQKIDKAAVPVRFIDGSILGGPPAPKDSPEGEWEVPWLPASGPHKLADIPGYGETLSKTLNIKHISDTIGAASGLKMCFASLSKGYTAIAIQSYTTAQRLGVLGDLQEALAALAPARVVQTEKGLVGMAPKAYRWVREMEEISKTHVEEGGFEPFIFQGAAGVYKSVAEDTVLGQEKIGQRKRGRTAEDIAAAMAEGLEQKRKKTD
ncbi:putative 6-phosphogluconate dehydrogenase protein [Phaeoacremonium minimum UCRPA7]|uniref:Putative 6-phosphogluconate dehydrogenase protein n=1 Tax=Phaeoacremonium minimum (strain UCR-PA7) TaxID=1286976 RepID=R8BF22_PHAM7|nr:putative 6-phosphogluconate dehydrogenase protein [Phaeoacremonium minimum UCRPA7]EON97900.1 putative 6-phosphogluconate dehydrogenase protein [Phaeoacremonium minimum UCRPA7]